MRCASPKRTAAAPELAARANGSQASGSNVLMQLRKAANHPALLRVFYTDEMLPTMATLIRKVRAHSPERGAARTGGR